MKYISCKINDTLVEADNIIEILEGKVYKDGEDASFPVLYGEGVIHDVSDNADVIDMGTEHIVIKRKI